MDHVYLITVKATYWITQIAVGHLTKVFETLNEWSCHKGMEHCDVNDCKAEDIRRYFHLDQHGTYTMVSTEGGPMVQITRHKVL